MKVYVKTFGCKTNFSDTISILGKISSIENVEISDVKDANLIIVNSCAVTKDAEKEVIKTIKRVKRENPKAKVVLAGCIPIKQKTDEILLKDEILPAGNYSLENIKKIIFGEKPDIKNVWKDDIDISEDISYSDFQLRCRAYIKIQEGCDKFCSFCSIPFTRGRPRSVPSEKILEKIEEIQEKYKEIILVGTHISLWGKDIGKTFGDLIKDITKKRIKTKLKFSSLSPGEIPDEFFSALKDGIFSPHFHISQQSFSNRVLKAMKRWHTSEDFEKDISKILDIVKDACIGTDIIVGFPTETEKDFLETVEKVKKLPLGHIHVFPFSPRPRTVGYFLKKLPEKEIEKRTEEMLHIAKEKRIEFMKKFIGKDVNVIVEKISSEKYIGVSRNYIDVVCEGKDNIKVGDEISVRIVGVDEERIVAYAVQNERIKNEKINEKILWFQLR